MKNEKDIWIDELMSSASAKHHQQKAGDGLYGRILENLDRPVPDNTISFTQFRLIGIAALLLITVNVGIFTLKMKAANNEKKHSPYGFESYDLNIYK